MEKRLVIVVFAMVVVFVSAAKPPPKKHYHYQKTYHSYPTKAQQHQQPIKPAKVSTYTKKGYIPVHVPTYEFGYKVHDPQHKNYQEKTETRLGDNVQGYYSLLQPNGEVRVVRYQSDDSGFHSKVTLHKHQDGRAGRFGRS